MVNKVYLKTSVLKEMASNFKNSKPISHIMLPNILTPLTLKKLTFEIKSLKFQKNFLPDQHSYFLADISKNKVFQEFIEDKKLKSLLSAIIKTKFAASLSSNFPKNITATGSYYSYHITDWQLQKFSHKSYTTLHDFQISGNIKYLLILDLSDNWIQNPNQKKGGELIVLGKDHHKHISPLLLPVQGNSLTIVSVKNSLYFTKYINHLAKNQDIIRLVAKIM